jgi:hypothetical protein
LVLSRTDGLGQIVLVRAFIVIQTRQTHCECERARALVMYYIEIRNLSLKTNENASG